MVMPLFSESIAQPEALRLADELEQSVNNPHLYWQGKAAAELRRQHERIKELEAQQEGDIGTVAYLYAKSESAKRIRELEQALDKAIRALESGLVIPTSEIATIREARRD